MLDWLTTYVAKLRGMLKKKVESLPKVTPTSVRSHRYPPKVTWTMLCLSCKEVLPLNPDYTLNMNEVEQVNLPERTTRELAPYIRRYVHNDCVRVDALAENLRLINQVEFDRRGTEHLRHPLRGHRARLAERDKRGDN
jgi:hypothetical protein